MSLVEIKDLTLGYGGQAVLEGINMTVEEGDFVCIVGPNGAGKTTLVKGILGLLKPMRGRVELIGLKQNHIGYMPQETKVDANFPASVYEIVLSGTLNRVGWRPFYGEGEKRVAKENMRLVGIEKLARRNFCDLSGGQRQKVLLVRSLAATTKLLILDEPSNNLDVGSKRELYNQVERLNRGKGITVMMITHDLDHGNLIGNKVLSLREEVFYGTTEEFVRKVHHE